MEPPVLRGCRIFAPDIRANELRVEVFYRFANIPKSVALTGAISLSVNVRNSR